MSDRDDPNLTLGPQVAREVRLTPRSTTLDLKGSIEDTHARRAGQREGVSATVLFVVGVIRNFVLGVPLTGAAFIMGYKASMRMDKALSIPGAAMTVHDLIQFIPAGVLGVVGIAFLAPAQVESAARFLGLGGLVDKLPFIRSRAPAKPAP